MEGHRSIVGIRNVAHLPHKISKSPDRIDADVDKKVIDEIPYLGLLSHQLHDYHPNQKEDQGVSQVGESFPKTGNRNK